jgi:hypothetical protein
VVWILEFSISYGIAVTPSFEINVSFLQCSYNAPISGCGASGKLTRSIENSSRIFRLLHKGFVVHLSADSSSSAVRLVLCSLLRTPEVESETDLPEEIVRVKECALESFAELLGV